MSSIQGYFEDCEDIQGLYKKTLKQKVDMMRVLYEIEKMIFVCEHFFETGELLNAEEDFPDPDLSPENLLGQDPSDE